MKLLVILSLIGVSFLPILPASAGPANCGFTGSTPNEGSSLTSTSEGGQPVPCPPR